MGDANSTELQQFEASPDTNNPEPVKGSGRYKRRRIKDHYTIGEKIGDGAFARVYRCFRKSDSCEFAVKRIDKRYLSRKELINLRDEIRILKRINHDNVIRLVDVFDNGRIVSMVLEMCSKRDLFDTIVNSDEPVCEERAAQIMHAVATGLVHLHERGVVHRDLKPENILFGVNDGQVKITDFGLSHYAPKAGKQSPSKKTKKKKKKSKKSKKSKKNKKDIVCADSADDNIDEDEDEDMSSSYESVVMHSGCGTPHYVSPEIVTGRAYNYKCDLWSLGVMLYVMLVGYQPFQGDDCNEVYKLIAQGKYELKSKRWKLVSKDGKHLVRRLLEANPKKRYSARDILCHPWVLENLDSAY